MSLRDDLIAAKALIDTPEKCACGGKTSGMTLHAAIDNTAGEDDDDRYGAMWNAIRQALPAVPPVKKPIEWSHEAPHTAIMLTFDRAIAAAEVSE